MKIRTVYRCTSCAHVAPKWLGRCPACGTWETMIEEVEAVQSKSKSRTQRSTLALVSSAATLLVDVQADQAPRIHTGMVELDRVLGGGLVPGSMVLVGGDPGMGKSTLMLQLASYAGAA
ncbi:MAG: DNA repair protein RadA, partial [Candidatus Kapabacteria bacterium]|nr:DNA repair protein RadA [Candidatus Kapabacteria bacterium]